MKGLALFFILLAAPVSAMTPEDCAQKLSVIAGKIKGAEEIRLAPDVTKDGWCRVIEGPLGRGLEWRLDIVGRDFELDLRQKKFVFEEIGTFEFSGRLRTQSNRLMIGPLGLTSGSGDEVLFSAEIGMEGSPEPGFSLSAGRLLVSGKTGLVNAVLAWAFRQDLTAARSSFISARDQRRFMEEWLEADAMPLIDKSSADAFLDMLKAYPRAKGVAVLSVREDAPVNVSGLINAVLFGAPFSRSEAGQLIEASGLTFTWQPG